MRRHTLPALLALALFWPGVAGGDEDEQAAIFARFEHAEHVKSLRRADLTCTSCHHLGGEDELAPPPEETCHACHNTGERARYGAPERCGTCHEAVEPPDSHGAAWINWHGQEQDATCNTCHERRDCVDCHERRQKPDFKVHDPGWIGLHGIEAGAGMTCDTCHTRNECTDCHGESP